jgi:hypothetical protein
MWTVALAWPLVICRAIVVALLTGIANPVVADCWSKPPLAVLAAVSMPITAPEPLTSGPPESPSWIGASVCSIPVRFSVVPAPLSLAVMSRFLALRMPCAVDGRPPLPPALPIASTGSPNWALSESPRVTVGRPDTVPPPEA